MLLAVAITRRSHMGTRVCTHSHTRPLLPCFQRSSCPGMQRDKRFLFTSQPGHRVPWHGGPGSWPTSLCFSAHGSLIPLRKVRAFL